MTLNPLCTNSTLIILHFQRLKKTTKGIKIKTVKIDIIMIIIFKDDDEEFCSLFRFVVVETEVTKVVVVVVDDLDVVVKPLSQLSVQYVYNSNIR